MISIITIPASFFILCIPSLCLCICLAMHFSCPSDLSVYLSGRWLKNKGGNPIQWLTSLHWSPPKWISRCNPHESYQAYNRYLTRIQAENRVRWTRILFDTCSFTIDFHIISDSSMSFQSLLSVHSMTSRSWDNNRSCFFTLLSTLIIPAVLLTAPILKARHVSAESLSPRSFTDHKAAYRTQDRRPR